MVKPNFLESWILSQEAPPLQATRFSAIDELGKALILAKAFSLSSHPFLLVFETKARARNAIDNLKFLLGREHSRKIHYFPTIDFDFYRGVLPDPETAAERNAALYSLLKDPSKQILVTTIGALLQKTFSVNAFKSAVFELKPNDEIEREKLIGTLLRLGYQRQPSAFDPGVFAVRGGVVDIYNPLYPHPARLEFYGDYIEEIRYYDEKSQLSLDKIEKMDLVPVTMTLFPQGAELETAAEEMKKCFDASEVPKSKRDETLDHLRFGRYLLEYGYLFPLLSGGSASLLEYLPEEATIWWDGFENLLTLAREEELPRLEKNHALYRTNGTALADRHQLFLTVEEIEKSLKHGNSRYFENFSLSDESQELTLLGDGIGISQNELAGKVKQGHGIIEIFAKKFREWMDLGYRIHILSHTQTHVERLHMLLLPFSFPMEMHPEVNHPLREMLLGEFTKIHLWQGYITESRVYPHLSLVLLSEDDIFGRKKRVSRSKASSPADTAKLLAAFRDLREGDYVVHKDFGIGRYLGLTSKNFQGVLNDYVLLEYQDGDKLYIPIYRLNILQKYVGGENASIRLDKLGTDQWAKAKSKAQKAIAELAAELLDLQAKRKLRKSYVFSGEGQAYHEFEMEFPFDETPDQQKAIEDVSADMGRDYSMDRLVCGDVGYGKTEVAMRAACRAIIDGKQVAVLVPTTVLAFQHYNNFKARFKNMPVTVEMVSRLKSSTETKKTLALLKEGKIDVLIGTHRLLSTDVEFKDLQLLIIDEEHRFGVVHKERLKKMAASIHVLSMTATPIPRTLNMAMTGIKDISIITTPPPDRLAVRTFVCRKSDEVITEAITNELTREGQVFIVHNRIETIFKLAEDLQRLLPKVKFEVVHGQMEPEVLEKKMLGFYQADFDVLITTAIIESGLDIPRANTMIIDHADRFGLAQLYQLRGRVGRSEKRAYCYLLVPPEAQMTGDAKQRIQVIQRYTDLGSGFSVASHDLELRGAGDLLGKDQHGHLNAIGVDLYFDLLEESILALKGEGGTSEIEPEINMKVAAFFPHDYIPDVGEKVNLYRRLSSAENEERISEVEIEIRDRFGNLPEEVLNLLGLMTLKIYLKKLHVVRLSSGPKRTSLQFASTTPASPQRLVALIQANPKLYSLTPDQKFVFVAENSDWKSQLEQIQKIMTRLGVE